MTDIPTHAEAEAVFRLWLDDLRRNPADRPPIVAIRSPEWPRLLYVVAPTDLDLAAEARAADLAIRDAG